MPPSSDDEEEEDEEVAPTLHSAVEEQDQIWLEILRLHVHSPSHGAWCEVRGGGVWRCSSGAGGLVG